MVEWQPVETINMNGEDILVWDEDWDEPHVVYYTTGEGWCFTKGDDPLYSGPRVAHRFSAWSPIIPPKLNAKD